MNTIKKLVWELKSNSGFRPKLAVLGYRIGFIVEYICKNKLFRTVLLLVYLILKLLCNLFSCGELPPRKAYIGWGLKVPHAFVGVIMTSGVKIGENCTLLHNTTMGSTINASGYHNSIIIGDNCYLGAHCLILGDTTIGDNCKVGAGTKLLNATIPSDSTVVMKMEYKVIAHK